MKLGLPITFLTAIYLGIDGYRSQSDCSICDTTLVDSYILICNRKHTKRRESLRKGREPEEESTENSVPPVKT